MNDFNYQSNTEINIIYQEYIFSNGVRFQDYFL